MDKKNPLTKQTIVNNVGQTTTFKTTIPALVRDVLGLENKDHINWELHLENRSVIITKVEENQDQ